MPVRDRAPPAGIAGGDRLSLDVEVGRDAFVQLTTPGAAKWYRSEGPQASRMLRVRVDERATFEWLPQGTIVYDGAIAASEVRIDLADTSTFIAAERAIRTLAASGEMAILLVEQYYDFAQSLADQYLVMERGEIVAHGAGADMERDGVRGLLAI